MKLNYLWIDWAAEDSCDYQILENCWLSSSQDSRFAMKEDFERNLLENSKVCFNQNSSIWVLRIDLVSRRFLSVSSKIRWLLLNTKMSQVTQN